MRFWNSGGDRLEYKKDGAPALSRALLDELFFPNAFLVVHWISQRFPTCDYVAFEYINTCSILVFLSSAITQPKSKLHLIAQR